MTPLNWLGVVPVFVGLVIAVVTMRKYRAAQAQFSWRVVPGEIISSSVHFTWDYYDPVIEFRYTVDGKRLQGTKVRTGAVSTNWRGPAAQLVAKYPPGTAVEVYVNPDNPRDAVLEPGTDPRFVPVMFFLSGLLSFGGFCFIFLAR